MSAAPPDPRLARVRLALARALARLGAESDPLVVAELLWLASLERGDAPAPDVEAGTSTPVEGRVGVTSPGGGAVGRSDESKGGTDAGEALATESTKSVRRERESPRAAAVSAPIPLAGTLGDTLPLVRALKPLRARRDGPPGDRVDEAATVRRITEEGVWEPVRLPTRAPVWRATIIVDDAPSMRLWDGRLGEIARVILQLGAFRGVRWSHLSRESAALRPGPPAGLRSRLPPDASPPGTRELVLVLTDGLDARWQDGRGARALDRFLSRGTVTFVHLLPSDLWPRTRLGRTRAPVTLRGERVDPPPALPWEKGAERGLPALLLDLDADALAAWARRVVRGAGGWRGGVMLKRWAPPVVAAAGVPAEERAQRFLASSRPAARRLAALLSLASEVDQVLVRAVRQAALPAAGFGVEAEVLLGGILEPVEGKPRLRFSQEAQRALEPELRGADVPRLYELLGGWLKTQGDVPASVATVLAAPESAAAVELDLRNPLVKALVEGMRAAGGAWGEVADVALPAFTENDEQAWMGAWLAAVERDSPGLPFPEPPRALSQREARAVRRRRPGGPSVDDPPARAALDVAAMVAAPTADAEARAKEDVARAQLVWDLVRRLLLDPGTGGRRAGARASLVLLSEAWWGGAMANKPEDLRLDQVRALLPPDEPGSTAEGPEAYGASASAVDEAVRRLREALGPGERAAPGGGAPAEPRSLVFEAVLGSAGPSKELVAALEAAVRAAGHSMAVQDPRRQGRPPRSDVYVLFGEVLGDAPLDAQGAVVLTFPGMRADSVNPDRDNWDGGDIRHRHAMILTAARSFTLGEAARIVVDIAEIEAQPGGSEAEEQVLRDVEAAATFVDENPTGMTTVELFGDVLARRLTERPALGSVFGWAIASGDGGPSFTTRLAPAMVVAAERATPWLRQGWLGVVHDPQKTDAARAGRIAELGRSMGEARFAAWASNLRRATLDGGAELSRSAVDTLLTLGDPPDADILPDPAHPSPNRLHLLYAVLAGGDRSDAALLMEAAFEVEAALCRSTRRSEARLPALGDATRRVAQARPSLSCVAAGIALEWAARAVDWSGLTAAASAIREGVSPPALTDALALAATTSIGWSVATAPSEDARSVLLAAAVEAVLAELGHEPPLRVERLFPRADVEPVALGVVVRSGSATDSLAALCQLAWGPETPHRDVVLAVVAAGQVLGSTVFDGVRAQEHTRALLALRRSPGELSALAPELRERVHRAIERYKQLRSPSSGEVVRPEVELGLDHTDRAGLSALYTAAREADRGPVVVLLPLGSGDGVASWLVFTPTALVMVLLSPSDAGARVQWAAPLQREPSVEVRGSVLHFGPQLTAPYDPTLHPDPDTLVHDVMERWEFVSGPRRGGGPTAP